MTKVFTTLVALVLVRDDGLDLDGNVNDRLSNWFVPDSQFTAKEEVTLRKLLSHQTGLVDAKGSFDIYRKGDTVLSCLSLLSGTSRYH